MPLSKEFLRQWWTTLSQTTRLLQLWMMIPRLSLKPPFKGRQGPELKEVEYTAVELIDEARPFSIRTLKLTRISFPSRIKWQLVSICSIRNETRLRNPVRSSWATRLRDCCMLPVVLEWHLLHRVMAWWINSAKSFPRSRAFLQFKVQSKIESGFSRYWKLGMRISGLRASISNIRIQLWGQSLGCNLWKTSRN